MSDLEKSQLFWNPIGTPAPRLHLCDSIAQQTPVEQSFRARISENNTRFCFSYLSIRKNVKIVGFGNPLLLVWSGQW